MRKRSSPGPNRSNSTGTKSNNNNDNMWKFYSEDSPGVKVSTVIFNYIALIQIGPVPVLVISLMFIGSVFIMHIWGKVWPSILKSSFLTDI